MSAVCSSWKLSGRESQNSEKKKVDSKQYTMVANGSILEVDWQPTDQYISHTINQSETRR